MVRANNAKRIACLFDEYAAKLELYASQWTALPEDCVQEAFMELARQAAWPQTPLAWLYRVVRNRALNQYRATKRRASYEEIAARLKSEKFLPEPSEQLALTDALGQLEQTEREYVILRIWSGLTWQEIAELTGTSSSGAQRKYVAALQTLRKSLDPTCQKNSD